MKLNSRKDLKLSISVICFLLIVIFSFSNFVVSKSINEVNEFGSVKYDSQILEKFSNKSCVDDLVNNTNFIGLKIIDDEVWAKVRVVLKDDSGIEVVGNKSERADLVNERLEWFDPITKKILKELPDSDFKDIKIRSEGFSAFISEKGFEIISNDKRIKEIIWSQYKPEFILDESAPLINADNVWSSGYTGDGIKVCIIDSGIDTSHLWLSSRIADEYCYNSDDSCPNNQDEDNSAEDEWGHGTRIAGVVASEYSSYKGIAYEADLYVVRVTDDDGEYSNDPFSDIGDAIDWCRNQGVDVISMSFRSGPYSNGNCPSEDINVDISNAYNAGITLVAGSGNDAKDNEIGYPACNSQVISVGGSYDEGDGTEEADWCEGTGGWWLFGNCIGSTFECIDYPEIDNLACWSNRNSDLDLLAPGFEITTTQLGGGFTSDYSGTSLSAPMVAGAAALLLEKDSSLEPDEIKYILQTTGEDVYDSESGMTFKRIDVEAALDFRCICDDPISGLCGSAGGCDEGDRRYTRDCDPSNCQLESYCSRDSACDGGTPSGIYSCTPDSCSGGYTNQGVNNYWNGNYWTSKRTCWKEELSNWIHHDDDSGLDSGYKSDGTVDCDDMYVDVPNDYEDLRIHTTVGYYSSSGEQNRVKWHIDAEDTSDLTSSCSSYDSAYGSNRYPNYCGSSCKVETYVDLFEGTSNCNDLCDGSCDDLNYWIECEADLYYKEYEDVYNNQYCDVPYTKTITLDSTIYGNSDADCYVKVRGSYSDPDEIKVKWYVNDHREEIDNPSCNEGSTCDKTVSLSNSKYSKGDEIYCIARGYGEDGGHGVYVSSSTRTVSNRVPTWSSISLNKDVVDPGESIQVIANSEADVDGDILAMYCCSGPSCTPTTSNHDFCYVVGDSSPYYLSCVGQATEIEGENTVRCRIYDGDDYSTIKLDTYEVENNAPPRMNLDLIYPTENINVTQNELFNVTVKITCKDNDCGGIDVSLDPKEVISEDKILENFSIVPENKSKNLLGTREYGKMGDKKIKNISKSSGHIKIELENSPITNTRNFMGESGESWIFEKVKIDELDGDIEYLGDNNFRIIPFSADEIKTNKIDYKWKTRISYGEKERDKKEIILKQNLKKEDIGNELTFTVPENITKFTFYFGETSTQIDATAASVATSYGPNENICIDSNGVMHVAYEGGGNDLWYGNSNNNGETWNTKELLSGSVTNVGIICSPNDDLVVYYLSSYDLDMFKSTNSGTSFTGPTTVEDDVDRFSGPIAGAVDSNNVVHWCGIDDDDDLIYVNSNNLDGGSVISSADSDHCDIEVDSDNNIYIAISESSTDDLDIMTNADSWSARTSINDGLGAVSSYLYSGLSMAIDVNDKIHIASIHQYDLQYCNGTTSLNSWSCREIDSSPSYNPDIAVTNGEYIYIFYQESFNDGDIYHAYITPQGGFFKSRNFVIQPSSSWVSIAHSIYPTSNRINNILHYIFTDSSDVYYDSIFVIPPGPDTTPPTVTLITPDNNSYIRNVSFYYNPQTMWTVNVTDDVGLYDNDISFVFDDFNGSTRSYVYTVSGKSIQPSLSGLMEEYHPEGKWKWYVLTQDYYGNAGYSENRTMWIDHTPPSISVTTPINGTNTSNNGLDIEFVAYDNFNLDSCLWTSNEGVTNNSIFCQNNIINEVWDEGWNTIKVFVKDSSGRESSDEISFFIQPAEIKSGLISTVVGTIPFYTNENNPRGISLNKDQSQLVTFWVNATGSIYSTHEFFAFANKTSNMSVSNITNTWDVTII